MFANRLNLLKMITETVYERVMNIQKTQNEYLLFDTFSRIFFLLIGNHNRNHAVVAVGERAANGTSFSI